MVSSVRIDDKAIQGSINRLRKHFRGQDIIMRNIGITLRDYVRETVHRGGRKRPHAPLAVWTKMRTGRRKPLRGVAQSFSYRSTRDEAFVFFNRETDGWDIDQHHKGWTIPARTNIKMAVPLHAGGYLVFRSAKAARVPAREIWPTQKEVRDMVSKMVTDWVKSGLRMSWRP